MLRSNVLSEAWIVIWHFLITISQSKYLKYLGMQKVTDGPYVHITLSLHGSHSTHLHKDYI